MEDQLPAPPSEKEFKRFTAHLKHTHNVGQFERGETSDSGSEPIFSNAVKRSMRHGSSRS